MRAAELVGKSRGSGGKGLSLGDALCLAVAERLELVVTGSDQAWETIDDLRVTFRPFR